MPRESKSAETRTRLIGAAGDALIEGEGDFEMSQLARRAGVSDGLPYHYFGSKAGALSARRLARAIVVPWKSGTKAGESASFGGESPAAVSTAGLAGGAATAALGGPGSSSILFF